MKKYLSIALIFFFNVVTAQTVSKLPHSLYDTSYNSTITDTATYIYDTVYWEADSSTTSTYVIADTALIKYSKQSQLIAIKPTGILGWLSQLINPKYNKIIPNWYPVSSGLYTATQLKGKFIMY